MWVRAMSDTSLVPAKILPVHLGRDAYVYVRQSILTQVREHTESLARQYELRERAVVLGWDGHQVRVIDADLGRSGSETTARERFKELVADVGLGQVGIRYRDLSTWPAWRVLRPGKLGSGVGPVPNCTTSSRECCGDVFRRP